MLNVICPSILFHLKGPVISLIVHRPKDVVLVSLSQYVPTSCLGQT